MSEPLLGRPYTRDLARELPYGAIVKDGIIVRVLTIEDYPELARSRSIRSDEGRAIIQEANVYEDLEREEAEDARRRKGMAELEAMFKDRAENADRHRLEAILAEEKKIQEATEEFKRWLQDRREDIAELRASIGQPCEGLSLTNRSTADMAAILQRQQYKYIRP